MAQGKIWQLSLSMVTIPPTLTDTDTTTTLTKTEIIPTLTDTISILTDIIPTRQHRTERELYHQHRPHNAETSPPFISGNVPTINVVLEF
jgi:hypothetical protein